MNSKIVKKNWNNFDPRRRRQNDLGFELATYIYKLQNK